MKRGKRKTRFVLSAWPSVCLRFSWRYELFVEGKIERKGSEASFKAPAGRGRRRHSGAMRVVQRRRGTESVCVEAGETDVCRRFCHLLHL